MPLVYHCYPAIVEQIFAGCDYSTQLKTCRMARRFIDRLQGSAHLNFHDAFVLPLIKRESQ